MYVGKAKNLKKRVASYFSKQITGERTRLLLAGIAKIRTIEVNSEIESLLLEANLIKRYIPEYNVKLTDAKAYPLIRITVKDKYPKVLISRRTDDLPPAGGSLYFGPYPHAGVMKSVLRTMRKIFPYQSVLNHPKKICLYHHLGLCPCPPVFDKQKIYRKNIKHLIDFLNGKINKVVRDLEKERNELSKKQEFEKAGDLQKKINGIKLITQQNINPFEYEANPSLREDLRKAELDSLKKVLNNAGLNVENLLKIECFDISNISGKLATGSMVVFVNGEKEKSLYRKFRIRLEQKPNDYAMIHEVVQRRLKHAEWNYPNLIIVDGGKAQVSATVKAINETKLNLHVIGLAKREEIIVTENFKEIMLAKDSNTLHLIQRIRDEAHRFAISYHKKLRSKKLLS